MKFTQNYKVKFHDTNSNEILGASGVLKLMQETGFNTVRLIIEYVVWKEEHDGFMERFDRYLSLCAKYGISCMIVLANDCMPPKTEL